MKSVHKTIGVLAVGFLVLTFWSILLYWPGKGFDHLLTIITLTRPDVFEGISDITKTPPNLYASLTNLNYWDRPDFRHSSQYSSMIALPKIYVDLREPNVRTMVYFDDSLGLFVHCAIKKVDNDHPEMKILSYAGPRGMSKMPNASMGRFADLVNPTGAKMDSLVVFDQNTHRFYRLNFNQKTVKAGREYAAADKRSVLTIYTKIHGITGPGKEIESGLQLTDRILVLDRTGRVDWFDLDKMDFTGPAGQVPNFDLAYAYRILPLPSTDSRQGLITASIMKGTEPKVAISLFDPSGKAELTNEKTIYSLYLPYASSVIFGRYLFVENLYSPITLLGAYVQGVLLKVPTDHSSLYWPLSSSFIIQGKRVTLLSDYLILLFPVLLPALVLSFFLARSVKKNAVNAGLSKSVTRLWFWTTLAFGLPAYITWRIVRPKEMMVTCKNCGKLRRPDFETCQHCKSLWQIPEITPPSWRVVASPDPCDLTAEPLAKQA